MFRSPFLSTMHTFIHIQTTIPELAVGLYMTILFL